VIQRPMHSAKKASRSAGSSAAQETFRLAPTPWDEIVAATILAGRPGDRRTSGASGTAGASR